MHVLTIHEEAGWQKLNCKVKKSLLSAYHVPVVLTCHLDFPGGQVVRISLSTTGGMSLILVRELRSHMPHGVAKRKKCHLTCHQYAVSSIDPHLRDIKLDTKMMRFLR